MRYVFRPEDKQWRFYDITQATERTLTLNDWQENESRVVTLDLTRSVEGRYTAVEFVGPESLVLNDLLMSAGEITDISDDPVVAIYGGNLEVLGKNRYQVTDPDKRRIAHRLPQSIAVPFERMEYGSPFTFPYMQTIAEYFAWTWWPTFMVRFPESEAGQTGWLTAAPKHIDYDNGIVDFGDKYLLRQNPNPSGTDHEPSGIADPPFDSPADVRLVYATFTDPPSARWPASGFSGTAHSEAGISRVYRQYDEMLAVGYERGEAITTAARIAAFTEYAKRLHAQMKDVVYAGGCTLDGMAWDFARLDRKVNFAAVDEDGSTITTGWESVGCFVTDVEYDIENNLTTLQFSSDQLELIGIDPDQAKQQLKIRALERVSFFSLDFRSTLVDVTTGFGSRTKTQLQRLQFNFGHIFVDPETGEQG